MVTDNPFRSFQSSSVPESSTSTRRRSEISDALDESFATIDVDAAGKKGAADAVKPRIVREDREEEDEDAAAEDWSYKVCFSLPIQDARLAAKSKTSPSNVSDPRASLRLQRRLRDPEKGRVAYLLVLFDLGARVAHYRRGDVAGAVAAGATAAASCGRCLPRFGHGTLVRQVGGQTERGSHHSFSSPGHGERKLGGRRHVLILLRSELIVTCIQNYHIQKYF